MNSAIFYYTSSQTSEFFRDLFGLTHQTSILEYTVILEHILFVIVLVLMYCLGINPVYFIIISNRGKSLPRKGKKKERVNKKMKRKIKK